VDDKEAGKEIYTVVMVTAYSQQEICGDKYSL